jgi:hypothetical protein
VIEELLAPGVSDRPNWTVPRLADEIEKRTGERISKSRLSLVLKKGLCLAPAAPSATKRSSDFIAFLRRLEASYGPCPVRQNKPFVLVLDNGPIPYQQSLAGRSVRPRLAHRRMAAEICPGAERHRALLARSERPLPSLIRPSPTPIISTAPRNANQCCVPTCESLLRYRCTNLLTFQGSRHVHKHGDGGGPAEKLALVAETLRPRTLPT